MNVSPPLQIILNVLFFNGSIITKSLHQRSAGVARATSRFLLVMASVPRAYKIGRLCDPGLMRIKGTQTKRTGIPCPFFSSQK